MFCRNCGNQLNDNAKFCNACGTPVEHAAVEKQHNQSQQTEQPDTIPARLVQEPESFQQEQTFPTGGPEQTPPASNSFEGPAEAIAIDAPQPNATPFPDQTYQATPVEQSPRKKRRPVIPIAIAAIVVVIAIVIGIGAVSPSQKEAQAPQQTSAGTTQMSAIDDAASLADELSKELKGNIFSSVEELLESEDISYDAEMEKMNARLARIDADIESVTAEQDSESKSRALTAMSNIREVLVFNQDILNAQKQLLTFDEDNAELQDYIDALNDFFEKWPNVKAPAYLQDIKSLESNGTPAIIQSFNIILGYSDSLLTEYSGSELYYWWCLKQLPYDNKTYELCAKQCDYASQILKKDSGGNSSEQDLEVTIGTVDRIAPNLYQSLDSAATIEIFSPSETNVIIEAEIPGFSQKKSDKCDVHPGINYYTIKPAPLPAEKMTNITNSSTTAINVTVTQDSNTVAQVSENIKLLSKNEFTWYDDQFGTTAAFDILAWLRPQAQEVAAINRNAASILSKWSNGEITAIGGYQYQDDWSATLLQVAAIQTAISNAGVMYTNDGYSFDADQTILTPDQVIQEKHGLCIETSLLMASCLLHAGMHPLIVITPGHAQVAIESYSGSGKYFLIETTELPYSGINAEYDYTQVASFNNGLIPYYPTSDNKIRARTLTGDSEEWSAYFDEVSNDSEFQGGIFVIDCALQKVLGIQGLENN